MIASRQESKREQIRAAAARLFLERGFAGTSMDAITAEAGVSKETIYRYYESKAQLFADVLGRLIGGPAQPPAGDAPLVVRNRTDLERLLVNGSRHYLARVMAVEQVALLRVVIAEGNRFPDLVDAFRQTLPASGGAMIRPILEAGQVGGVVPQGLDLRTVGRALAGLLMTFIVRDGLLAADPHPPDREQVEELVSILVRGIAQVER